MPDLHEFSFLTVCLRLVLAVVVGGIIGFGRSRKKETAGLRTYLIPCVGAALTALLASPFAPSTFIDFPANMDWSDF